jgi:hypothetical protein
MEQGFLDVGSKSYGEGGPSVVLLEKHVGAQSERATDLRWSQGDSNP